MPRNPWASISVSSVPPGGCAKTVPHARAAAWTGVVPRGSADATDAAPFYDPVMKCMHPQTSGWGWPILGEHGSAPMHGAWRHAWAHAGPQRRNLTAPTLPDEQAAASWYDACIPSKIGPSGQACPLPCGLVSAKSQFLKSCQLGTWAGAMISNRTAQHH